MEKTQEECSGRKGVFHLFLLNFIIIFKAVLDVQQI